MSELQGEWDRNTRGLKPNGKLIAAVVVVIILWLIIS